MGSEGRTSGGEAEESAYSVNFLYKFIAGARARKALPHISGRVLDAGCGIGTLKDYLSESNDYVGFDVDPRALEYFRARHPEARALCLDIQEEGLTGEGEFDTVTCLAVVEHLEDPLGFLRRCADSLRPGGTLVVTSPTRIGEFVRNIICAFHFVSPGCSEPGEAHDTNYSLKELSDLVRESGCDVVLAKHFQLGINQIVVGKKC